LTLPTPWGMAAICAYETPHVRPESTSTGHSGSRGAIPAVRDRDVLPSQLRSRLNVADKSQCLLDLRHFRRGRKAFECRGENGIRVDGAAA
jgi:hypothetical protein